MKRKEILFIVFIGLVLQIPVNAQSSKNLQAIINDTIAYQQAIPVSEIVQFEQETKTFLTNTQTEIDNRGDLKNIPEEYTELDSLIQLKSPASKESIIEAGPIALQNQEGEWKIYQSKLSSWNEDLRNRLSWFEIQQVSIGHLIILWETTRTAAVETQAPAAVIQRISDLQSSILELENFLNISRNNLLQKDVAISDLLTQVVIDLGIINEVKEESVRSITILESPPLLKAIQIAREDVDQPPLSTRIKEVLKNRGLEIMIYFRTHRFGFYVAFISLFIFFTIQLYLKLNIARWLDEYAIKNSKDPHSSNDELNFLGRPISVSILLSLLLMVLILPGRPIALKELMILISIYPIIRITNIFLLQRTANYVFTAGILIFIGHINNLIVELQPLNRVILVIISLTLTILLVLIIRSKVLNELKSKFLIFIGALLIWLGTFSMVVALISNFFGNVTLASYLAYGILDLIFNSLLIFCVTKIFINLNYILVKSPGLQKLKMILKFEDKILSQFNKIYVLIAVLIWLSLLLKIFEIRDIVTSRITDFFTASISIGSFSFSLGDILMFFFVIWVSIIISKLVRFVLEEEIFPRAKTRRGTSATITTFVRITIISLGFIVAIAASGFALDKITILIGAFGVGIGFGLQNIINNLVSGFIIATERPMEVGDIIEVGALVGEVRSVGIRSSVVRTYDGSEVIVPNGNLVSNELINWTHSDQLRRLKIPIGVAYGSDVHKVLEVLEKVGKSDERVLQSPSSYVLFQGMGDSSLNFEYRCWTQSEDWIFVLSDLIVLAHDTLKEHGIEIPFPQRDLHLRSVDKEILSQTRKNIPPNKKK